MSLTVSTGIPRTGSTGGGAPFLSAKVGGLSPLPLPPLYLRPWVYTYVRDLRYIVHVYIYT